MRVTWPLLRSVQADSFIAHAQAQAQLPHTLIFLLMFLNQFNFLTATIFKEEYISFSSTLYGALWTNIPPPPVFFSQNMTVWHPHLAQATHLYKLLSTLSRPLSHLVQRRVKSSTQSQQPTLVEYCCKLHFRRLYFRLLFKPQSTKVKTYKIKQASGLYVLSYVVLAKTRENRDLGDFLMPPHHFL